MMAEVYGKRGKHFACFAVLLDCMTFLRAMPGIFSMTFSGCLRTKDRHGRVVGMADGGLQVHTARSGETLRSVAGRAMFVQP